jgi:hypothetical protein
MSGGLAELGGSPGGIRTLEHSIKSPVLYQSELLSVCARLADLQAQWQGYWAATPDEPNGGPDDIVFKSFSTWNWPGVRLGDWAHEDSSVIDLPALLLTLPATTTEELRAKAAAVLAISDVSDYTGDCRTDEMELLRSVARDAAGPAFRPVGHAAGGGSSPLPIAANPGDNSSATTNEVNHDA